MGRMSHRNQERTERRISAAASLMLCALTVLAQIAVTLLLTRFLKEKASFVYGFLQLIGAAVAIRVYQRSGSPSYKLSWMCLLLILPVAGMLLFCLWGGTHQAKQLSLKPVPPIPQRESAKMLSDLNQTALTRRSPAWGRLAAYLQKRQFWLYRNTDAAYFGEGESFFRAAPFTLALYCGVLYPLWMTTGASKWARMVSNTITSRGATKTASLPSPHANSRTLKWAESCLPPEAALL